MEDKEFKIDGIPITLLKSKQIEAEIRKRGGKIPTNSVKDSCISQLREILKEEQKQSLSSKKRTSNGELPSPNKKVALGDPKALQLEKKILNGFNFYPIVERLKFDELGFRLVKEYTRFIVIKILTQDIESVKTLPPPLIGRIWISHILDTNRYEELCNLIELKIHHNPDGFEEVPQQVKRERYVKTLELYDQYFTKSSKDPEIWENDYLLYDEEDNDDDDDYDDDDELQQEKEKEKQKDKEKEKEISIKYSNDKKQKEGEKETDKKANNSEIENKNSNNNSNGIKQISKEDPTTAASPIPQKVLNPPKVKNAPTPNTQANLNGESTSTTASVASDNSPNKHPTPNTSSSSKNLKQPQTPNTPSSATTTTTPQQQPEQTSPSTSKPARGGDNKISIGFVSLKTQKKEITTFHGVGLNKSLFKVIKAYSKLKNVDISSVKFLFNGNPIMNETPIDLGMKDGDTITVHNPSSSASSSTTTTI
ncbi:hypothetical protein ACTFIV_001302 [Dictyostelium citrinum]